MNEIIEIGGRDITGLDPHKKTKTALGLWLAGFRSENTRRAYRREILASAAYTGQEDASQALEAFFALEDGPAHALSLANQVVRFM
jgi:hypothetical protein